MKKFLVTIEFRYKRIPSSDIYSEHTSKTVTIGVFDSFDEACIHGNKELEALEARFNLHRYPSGEYAKKARFSANGGCFGSKVKLVTNLAYLNTPFSFFAKITELKHENVDSCVDKILDEVKEYRKNIKRKD